VTGNANGEVQCNNIVCWHKDFGDAKSESVMRKHVSHIDNESELSVLVNFKYKIFVIEN